MGYSKGLSSAIAASAMLISLTACAASKTGEAAAPSDREKTVSCARIFTYEGRSYRQVVNLDFTVAEALGTATREPCNDTGQSSKGGESVTKSVYKVADISSKVAIAVGDTPEDASLFAVHSGGKLPRELQDLSDGAAGVG